MGVFKFIFKIFRKLGKLFRKLLFPRRKRKGRKTFGITSVTENGETVRSKSEKKVADWLSHHKIEYEYEILLQFPDGKKLLNDFYLPKYDINIEFYGMNTKEYLKRKKEKNHLYRKYRLKLISIESQHLDELDTFLPKMIRKRRFKRIRWFPVPRFYQKTSLFTVDKSELEKVFCVSCGNEGEKGSYCVECGERLV